MATPPTFTTVVPILNDCTLFGRTPCTFGNDGWIGVISDAHFTCIVQKYPSLAEVLAPRTKYFVTAESGNAHTAAEIDRFVMTASFCLNVLSTSSAISAGRYFTIKRVRSHSVSSDGEIGYAITSSRNKYTYNRANTPDQLSAMYLATRRALVVKPKLALSIRRFNAALIRQDVTDKIVDMTICLESLFDAQTEISFRFALYNSILSESDPLRREENYKMLKKLYSIQTDVIHGNKEIDPAWHEANWPRVIKIARLSLLRKIDFLGTHAAQDWQAHLDKLALGAEGT